MWFFKYKMFIVAFQKYYPFCVQFFLYWSKNTIFHFFTDQKKSRILRKSVCGPLSNSSQIKNNNSDVYQNIQNIF